MSENVVDTAIPAFDLRPEQDKLASRDAGRPIFRDVEYVTIIVPGMSKTVVVERVKDEHRRRWPRQYEAWKAKQEAPVDGTPLEEWPKLTGAQVSTLKALHIKTVEALANLPAQAITKIGHDGQQLVQAARKFLEFAAGSVEYEEKLAKLQARISELEEENERLKAEAPKKRKPGRPPKAPPPEPVEAQAIG